MTELTAFSDDRSASLASGKMAEQKHAVIHGGRVQKVSWCEGEDSITAVAEIFPELKNRVFHLAYYDKEVEEYIDLLPGEAIPEKVKLMVKLDDSVSLAPAPSSESSQSLR